MKNATSHLHPLIIAIHLLQQNSRATLTGVGIIHHNLDCLLQAHSHDAPCHRVIICRPISGINKEVDLLKKDLASTGLVPLLPRELP